MMNGFDASDDTPLYPRKLDESDLGFSLQTLPPCRSIFKLETLVSEIHQLLVSCTPQSSSQLERKILLDLSASLDRHDVYTNQLSELDKLKALRSFLTCKRAGRDLTTSSSPGLRDVWERLFQVLETREELVSVQTIDSMDESV